MLSIMPTTNYNTNFKSAPTKHDIGEIAEQITRLTVEEKIVPKDRFQSSLKINGVLQKIKAKFKNLTFRYGLMIPKRREYDHEERIKKVIYKDGSYKIYEYHPFCADNQKVVEEEKLPSGETIFYNVYTEKSKNPDRRYDLKHRIKSIEYPDGKRKKYFYNTGYSIQKEEKLYSKEYDLIWHRTYYDNGGLLIEENLPEGTKKSCYRKNGRLAWVEYPDGSQITYFPSGRLEKAVDANGNVIESNLYKEKSC